MRNYPFHSLWNCPPHKVLCVCVCVNVWVCVCVCVRERVCVSVCVCVQRTMYLSITLCQAVAWSGQGDQNAQKKMWAVKTGRANKNSFGKKRIVGLCLAIFYPLLRDEGRGEGSWRVPICQFPNQKVLCKIQYLPWSPFSLSLSFSLFLWTALERGWKDTRWHYQLLKPKVNKSMKGEYGRGGGARGDFLGQYQ